MANQNETGHAVNVANLEKYNQFLVHLGQTYNPGFPAITISALQSLYTNAKTKLNDFKIAFDLWKAETNQREIAFQLLDPFSTRLLSLLKSTDASSETIDDFAFLVLKIHGRRKTRTKKRKINELTNEATQPVVTRSTSQQSYDLKLEHFSKMVLLLSGVATYQPNEPELKIATLQTRLNNLQQLNDNASGARANLMAARGRRNETLYAANTGLIDLVNKSKAYVLAVYGRTSQQYKTVASYKFKRIIAKR